MSRANLVLTAAAELAVETAGRLHTRADRMIGGYYIRLTRIDCQYRLVLARHDYPPSADEMTAVCQAAGGPVDVEPVQTMCTVSSQDGAYRRLPALVAGWRQVE